MTIVAEIGTAHGGSLQKAYSLIDAACDAGADCIKFQWVYADEILHPDTGFVTLPGGKTRLYDRFKALETDSSFFKSCLEYTHKKGLMFACSPFGLKSLEELVKIQPDAIKIASPEVNHTPLLKATASYYGKIPIILSSGVSTLGDIEKAIDTITSKNEITAHSTLKMPYLTLLHCITFYPAPEEEYNVKVVDSLKRIFGYSTGISDHSLDPVLIPVLSVLEGGTMIEKHITLSRATDGLDDPVALEPQQFAQMVHSVHQTEAILNRYHNEELSLNGGFDTDLEADYFKSGFSKKGIQQVLNQLYDQYGKEKVLTSLGNGVKTLAQSEKLNYGRTNRSLHYMKNLSKGSIIKPQDIAVLRTEKILTPGISPDFLETITGSILARDVKSGDGVLLEDFINKKS